MNYTPLKMPQPKGHKKPIFLLIGVLFLVFSTLAGGFFVMRGRTNIVEQAATPPPSPTLTKRVSLPTGGACSPNQATCSWLPPDGATTGTTYIYRVVDQDSGASVAAGTTSNLAISFLSKTGQTYQCTVVPKNACGEGASISTVATCQESSSSRTLQAPTSTDSAMVALTSTVTTVPPTRTPTPTTTLLSLASTSPTASPTSTPTRTPTPTATKTPSPTEIIIAQNLPSVTAIPTSAATTATPTIQVVDTTTPTVVETIPAAGSKTGIYFAALSSLLLVTLLFVF